MKKIHAILKGWKNYLLKDLPQEKEAQRRAKICIKCPKATPKTYAKLMPDNSIKAIQGLVCLHCGCPLSTLLRQEDIQCDNHNPTLNDHN